MSIREDILLALKALAETAVGASATVYRSRSAALARSEGSAVLIQPDEEAVQAVSQFRVVRDWTIVISVLTRDRIPDARADPIIALVHAALIADQTLGGRCARIVEQGSRWGFAEADQDAGSLDVRYVIHYLTPANALAAVT